MNGESVRRLWILIPQVWFVALFAWTVEARAEPKATEPALQGYCPVSYFTTGQAIQGDPTIQAEYAGQFYYFATLGSKVMFATSPESYLPEFDGLCTTALGGSYGNRIKSDPRVFEIRDGRLYLFSSQRAKDAYERNPGGYIEQANQLFGKPAVGGHCLVSTRKQGKAVRGDAGFPTVYRGFAYHFADAEARAEFLKDPTCFLPQFDNLCAVGVAHGKRFPADGTRVRVVDGRTYLLFDAEAEKEFDAEPQGVIQKASEEWPALKDKK